jgi:hypothetical protein
MIEPDRIQTKIRRMRIAGSIPKATNILLEYIILIVYPVREWLLVSAAMLR